MSPTKIATAVRCVLLAVAAFGIGLTGVQVAAVAIAVEAVAELFVSRRVTANNQIIEVETAEEAFNLLTEGLGSE
jgi:hypothetical protein